MPEISVLDLIAKAPVHLAPAILVTSQRASADALRGLRFLSSKSLLLGNSLDGQNSRCPRAKQQCPTLR
jgi:hypothetical protein